VHLHDHLPETVERVAKVYKLGPDDRIFSSSRLFFAYGLGNSFSFPIGSGCSVVLCSERPTPQLIADILKRHRPTVFFAVPAVFRALIEYAKQGNKLETGSLKFCVSAGEVLPVATWNEWKALTGVEIIETIGTTELLHAFIHNFPDRNRVGSSGVVLDGYQVKASRRESESHRRRRPRHAARKGRSAIPYYLNKPEKTAELIQDGWVKTGDIYRRDEEGFYWFEGAPTTSSSARGCGSRPARSKDAVTAHPAVLEAAVVAEADDKGATIAAAYVALRPGHKAGEALSKDIMEQAADEAAALQAAAAHPLHGGRAAHRHRQGSALQAPAAIQPGVLTISCRAASSSAVGRFSFGPFGSGSSSRGSMRRSSLRTSSINAERARSFARCGSTPGTQGAFSPQSWILAARRDSAPPNAS
jgi:acyl-coenzyme A synthetase/AMP-(fatty) acid ligase